MAPNQDLDSCENTISNYNLPQMDVISNDNSEKAISNRAFCTSEGDFRGTTRCFEDQQISDDMEEHDNSADKSNAYIYTRQETSYFKLKKNFNNVLKDDVLKNQKEADGNDPKKPSNHNKDNPSDAGYPGDEEQTAENANTRSEAHCNSDNPDPDLYPSNPLQMEASEDAGGNLGKEDSQKIFNGGVSQRRRGTIEGKGIFPVQTCKVSEVVPSEVPQEISGNSGGVNKNEENAEHGNLSELILGGYSLPSSQGEVDNNATPLVRNPDNEAQPVGNLVDEEKSSSGAREEEEISTSNEDKENPWKDSDGLAHGSSFTPPCTTTGESAHSTLSPNDAVKPIEPTPFNVITTLIKNSSRPNAFMRPALPRIQEEMDEAMPQCMKQTGVALDLPPARSAGSGGSGTSASLSSADVLSLAANRGGSPPQISPNLAQISTDQIEELNNRDMLNLVLSPTKMTSVFSTETQPYDKKKPIKRAVPTLKSIVTRRFVKITENVNKAFVNLVRKVNLEVPGCHNENFNTEMNFPGKVVGTEDPLAGTHRGMENPLKVLDSIETDIAIGKNQQVQPKFLKRTDNATESQCPPTKTSYDIICEDEDLSSSQQSLCLVLMVRIIHLNPQDQYQSHYQRDGTAAVSEPEAVYLITIKGISESQIQSRIKSLQENFDSFFPSYRRWRYGKNAAKGVEFYIMKRGRNGVSFQKVCNIDVRGRDHDQCHVYESKIQEVPQFVEVMQPRPGIISDVANDPPGQQSVYIPPGDHRREAYRLSTYESFPKQTPINVPELAKYGFFYTGFYDRVKCYSCGRTVEHWAAGDNPSDKRWHKQDCLLARGVGSDNIPIGGRFSSLLLGSSSSGASSSSTPQPMDVGTSHAQSLNGPIPRGVDVTELTRQGGTYQMKPNSTFVIGPTSVQTHQTAPRSTTNNPPARNPPRQWRMANVISADHKRYLTNLYLNRELDRLASFCRWPTGRPNVAPVALARAGFFYLGDMDRTQCFSCGGVLRNWSADDDAMVEHRTHLANCRIVVGVERRNVPIPEQAETPMELAEKYPCRFPMNPHMRSEPSRLATFDRRWPADRTRAQPQEIAEAGFFFLGERDRVKCWYCNGGLQNWEYDDVPWIEHAKWFPNCQFLLAKQGQLFVYRYLSLSPHLPRPTIGRQDGALVDPSTATVHTEARQSSRAQDVPVPSATRVRAPSPPPAIIDPQEELRKRRERVEKELKENEMVKIVLAMGYEENLVRRTLLDKLESGRAHDAQNIYEGTAALLDAVLEKEAELEREREEEQATSIKFPTMSSLYSVWTAGSMDTSPSGPPSGVHQVSGFDHEDDDEDRDLYSSIAEGSSSGAVGGVTSAPSTARNETKPQHIWKDIPEDQESIKEFIEQKKEERLCKICFTETADMVFIPCSHMVCCITCTEAIRHCPICRQKIEKAIKTYVK